jgi:hypothetical protein
VIDHLVVSHRKKVRLALFRVDILPVTPHFFKSALHYVTGIFLVAEIFYDKAENIIGVSGDTVVIFFLSHKQSRFKRVQSKPGFGRFKGNTDKLYLMLHETAKKGEGGLGNRVSGKGELGNWEISQS